MQPARPITRAIWHESSRLERVGSSSQRRNEEGTLSKYLLKLYVTGSSSRSDSAITNLRRICEEELEGQYQLEIIDVLEFPDQAEDARILATPTLIKSLPVPLRRVIGDLSDKEKVLLGLQLRPTVSNSGRDEAAS